jgi:hypothetical protein
MMMMLYLGAMLIGFDYGVRNGSWSCYVRPALILGSGRGMAGELGFEPRSSVLETDSLTVELTPPQIVRNPYYLVSL